MAVFGLVSSVAGFVKVRYLVDKAIIDNMIFRFHYRITSALLFASCIILTANNLIGDPINCINDGAVPDHVINTYCWITYTFTLPYQMNKLQGREVAHPGIGNQIADQEESERYHSYYQWVPFMLFFQGVLFYIPHWVWKNWEEGKVRMVTDGIRGAAIGTKQMRINKQNRLVEYFVNTLHMHNLYAAGYFFCEILNFINVVGNIFFLDTFLNGAFLKYGTEVIKFSGMNQENRTDPMIAVFPRVTKCTFHKFGPSGSIQTHDALCILALNILNEKIFIFLWFWLIILSALSGLALLYSSMLIVLPSVREIVLKHRFRFGSPTGVPSLIRKTQVGDFLFLHLLGQNMDLLVFGEILDELSRRLHIGNNLPSAPSSLELSPIYPSEKLPGEKVQYGKETET
ncbi:Innexin inx2, putative [Pediculus humanus corporis]|uniref:Innexin n=1 Tax=Pediculus humanus subsp. corporis TaxID=121224 RepID=E0VNL8_PEDHC|nr:Innexin inx2, putative [Pediculus humanus corporis]EEB14974.1 Innexin inx2, putative [Pediculus humanus corporis]